MMALEEGPFSIFQKYRGLFDIDPNTGEPKSWVGRGFYCPLCISFWAAIPVAIYITGSIGLNTIHWWLAIAGGAVFLYKQERDS